MDFTTKNILDEDVVSDVGASPKMLLNVNGSLKQANLSEFSGIGNSTASGGSITLEDTLESPMLLNGLTFPENVTSIDVTVCGKNMLDGTKVSERFATFDPNTGTLTGTVTTNTAPSFVKIQKYKDDAYVETIIFNYTTLGKSCLPFIKDGSFDGILIGFNCNKVDQTLLFNVSYLPNGSYKICFTLDALAPDGNGDVLKNIMVLPNLDCSTDYEPHQSTTVTVTNDTESPVVLRSYDGVTNVFNAYGADMSVRYELDCKKYIDKLAVALIATESEA